jgi:hypothetical protein
MPHKPIKMPPRPLGPGQVEVKLGAKRYMLNVPEVSGLTAAALRPKFHPDAFALVWPAIGHKHGCPCAQCVEDRRAKEPKP